MPFNARTTRELRAFFARWQGDEKRANFRSSVARGDDDELKLGVKEAEAPHEAAWRN